MWPNGVPKHSHCFPSETTESLITSQDPAILSKQSSSHQKDLYEAEIKYFFFFPWVINRIKLYISSLAFP